MGRGVEDEGFCGGGEEGAGWWVVRPWWVCGLGVGVLIGGFGGFGEELLVYRCCFKLDIGKGFR